jgi:hypothetical protein
MTNGLLNNYRFSFWLPLFAGLLILIPISIWLGLIGLAKTLGVSVLLLLIFAMRKWFALARLQNNRVARIELTTNDLFILKQINPSFSNWSGSDQRILIDQVGLFLAEVRFSGAWTPKSQLSVAFMSICATWDSSYINRQHWTLYYKEEANFYFEQAPNTIYSIPTNPMPEQDLLGLQNNNFIAPLKKGIESLK